MLSTPRMTESQSHREQSLNFFALRFILHLLPPEFAEQFDGAGSSRSGEGGGADTQFRHERDSIVVVIGLANANEVGTPSLPVPT
jgi:hypothetical protein